jgi:hypothetical protein
VATPPSVRGRRATAKALSEARMAAPDPRIPSASSILLCNGSVFRVSRDGSKGRSIHGTAACAEKQEG